MLFSLSSVKRLVAQRELLNRQKTDSIATSLIEKIKNKKLLLHGRIAAIFTFQANVW